MKTEYLVVPIIFLLLISVSISVAVFLKAPTIIYIHLKQVGNSTLVVYNSTCNITLFNKTITNNTVVNETLASVLNQFLAKKVVIEGYRIANVKVEPGRDDSVIVVLYVYRVS